MAGTRLWPNHQRTPSLRGSLTRYYSNGQWLVRAWPRKRGTPKSLKVRNQNNWFREAVQLAKRVPASHIELSKQQALDSGLYPKDPLMSAMAGNLYELVLEDGTIIEKWVPKVHPIVFTGCRLLRTSTLLLTAGVLTTIPWQSAALDTAGFFDPAVPTDIVIPTGVNVVEMFAGMSASDTGATYSSLRLLLLGAGYIGFTDLGSSITHRQTTSSGPIAVAPGLTFQCQVRIDIASTLQVDQSMFFSCNVLDAD